MSWRKFWRPGEGAPEVDASRNTSIQRRLLFLLAPVVSVGAVMGLASACAISAASGAAAEVKAITADAATLVDLLPSSDNVPCATCEPLRSDAGVGVAPAIQKTPNVESQNKVSGATAASVKLPEKADELPGKADELPGKADVVASHSESVPLDAPRCDGIAAYIITVFDKAKHSVASLSSDPRRQAIRRREGQKFGEYRVAKIDFNRRKMSSAVWLESDAGLCQVLLRDHHPKREKINRAAVRRQKLKARRLRHRRKKKRR